MTHWNLSFDYAAVFLLLMIIIWYFNEKRIPLKSHKAFFALITVSFAATGLEIVATQMARSMDSFDYDLFYSILNIQNLAVNLVPLVFTYYILQLAHVDISKNILIKTAFIASIAVDVTIAVLNPILKWTLTYENHMYISGYMGTILYIIDAVMVIICVIIIFRSSEYMVFARAVILFFNIICGIAACFVQLISKIPVFNFMVAVICLTLYYYMQNPVSVMDSVTKLFNRKFMGEYIQSIFKSQKRFGIISVAMDDFKFINKTYGVDNGDNLLLQVGGFLDGLKLSKTVFRFGSDEFCVVINKDVDGLENAADIIQERFRHPWYNVSSSGIMMSASICCIECPKDAASYGELVEVMDYSMSVAKKTRKGSITFASEIELDNIRDDKAIEKAVKLAMDRETLMVYYQPIFSVSKGVYNSAEALVRLKDEKLGWISPEKFIPIAEKNGLIIEMGEMIFEQVCRFIRDYRLSETTIEYIEVNISPVQLIQIDFADRIISIMEKYNVLPSQINMEITETATICAMSVVNSNINKLVEYGINFSLDDYGSGYSNIDYINRMPFKIIKLDKYIIWDAFDNHKAGITLKYTIGMLNALQLLIVAEGVETEEMKDRLVDIGCHYMQGWYYSKAVSDKEFINLLSREAGA